LITLRPFFLACNLLIFMVIGHLTLNGLTVFLEYLDI
jgi:hypothetical protein